jgi:simple sugar transport system permease protein
MAKSLLAVAAALLLGAAIVALIGENPLDAGAALVDGVFGSWSGVASVLFTTTTLLFAGLAVAIPYRGGLFNIGGEGQLLVGAFAAALVPLALPFLPGIIVIPAAMIAAALAGAVWGAIPGLLRSTRGVHEVINTIMMNFIAAGLTGYLTVHVFQEPGMIPQTAPIPVAARLPRLGALPIQGNPFPASNPANIALFVALAAVLFVSWLVHRTPFGYELRALGQGERAAMTAGISPKRTILTAMAWGGALAGLGGVNEVLGFRYRFLDNFTGGIGFLGIAVALLGRLSGWGMLLAALLIGALSAGAIEIDLFTRVPRDIIWIVQAVILLFVVAGERLVVRSPFFIRRRA